MYTTIGYIYIYIGYTGTNKVNQIIIIIFFFGDLAK